MHCPNCGKELNGSEKFCGGCGNDLTHLVYTSAPAAGSAPDTAAVHPARHNARTRSIRRHCLRIILNFLLFLRFISFI